ncbi:MAG TPA: winged helix-turn-helix domain-containing protein, partial [Ktedonobacterales bacterium]
MAASEKADLREYTAGAQVGVLPDDVPVRMPNLPISTEVTTEQQLKAFGDPVRTRILGIIQNQPATAKQIADRLGYSPGAVGHHLQVLEEAGLAKVVARRLVRGIVAKYYTRTARIFNFHLPKEIRGATTVAFDMMTHVRDEMAEAEAARSEMTEVEEEEALSSSGFPHARISLERAREFEERLSALIDEFTSEPIDPRGQVYGFGYAFFLAPPYLQVPDTDNGSEGETEAKEPPASGASMETPER